jgi:hypothetical protein
MRIVNVPSKSNPKIFRQVRISENIDGSKHYECSCPANVWYRVSGGRHGSINCRHITEVWEKEEREKLTLDNEETVTDN